MKIVLSCLLALPLLGLSGMALADQDHGHGHGHGHDAGWHGADHGRHDDDDRRYSDDDDRRWRDDDRDYHHDRGWHGRGHHWERGHRYTGPVVIVRDYDDYRLRPPPRGYHWVRDQDDNFVLVAIATGIVLDAVFH